MFVVIKLPAVMCSSLKINLQVFFLFMKMHINCKYFLGLVEAFATLTGRCLSLPITKLPKNRYFLCLVIYVLYSLFELLLTFLCFVEDKSLMDLNLPCSFIYFHLLV